MCLSDRERYELRQRFSRRVSDSVKWHDSRHPTHDPLQKLRFVTRSEGASVGPHARLVERDAEASARNREQDRLAEEPRAELEIVRFLIAVRDLVRQPPT